jgi:cellulose synthase/poly-beta-1,6-N-acetylglucosamine synthase-like glycosyltransferase
VSGYPTLLEIVYWTYIACLFYFLAINLYYLAIFAFASSENRLRVQQQRHEDFLAISRSRHTLPVSVIIPAYNEEQPISDCLYSLVKLDYPQYEVIVVNDGSKDRTLDVLNEEFKLVRADIFSRRHFETAKINAVYRSTIYEEFYVIDKANGGKADSLNAGINFSRYPYVCTCDADTIFGPYALLRGIRMILRDPEKVVAVGSLIGINNGCEIEKGEIRRFGIPKEPIVVLQLIEYLRSFLLNRLAWTRLNFMLVVSGAFAIYRRNVLIELGGFSKEFTCEDIEMTFRVHEHMRRNKIPYHILSLPGSVSWTEAPHTAKNLYRQRHRWQRVICETFWRYRRMLFNPRYGTVGMLGMPYYLFGEVLPWIPELTALVIIPLAIWLGVFTWIPLLLFMGIYTLTNVFFSMLAIFLHDIGSRSFTLREIRRLILISFIESFGYRQLLSAARIAGTFGFLRGQKGWQKSTRVERKDLSKQPLSTGPAQETFRQESPALVGSTERVEREKTVEGTLGRQLAVQFTDPAPEEQGLRQEQGLTNGCGEGDDSIMEDQLRADGTASETSEDPGASEPRLPRGPARPLRRLSAQRTDPEERSETCLGEVAARLGDRLTRLKGEDEDVSGFVRDLDEYVERVGSLRDKLAEDARRIGELREKLQQDTSEIDALRSQIEEEILRIDKLIQSPPASAEHGLPPYPKSSS